MNYICRIAALDDMNKNWDYQISKATNKSNWIKWKEDNIQNFKNKKIIPYYGILNDEIICEATVALTGDVFQNSDGLVSKDTAYLMGFRTRKDFEGKGYFSILYKFMEQDLINKGFKLLTLGVEPKEIRNYEIYKHWGFNDYIKSDVEVYPDGTKIDVNYYAKKLIKRK